VRRRLILITIYYLVGLTSMHAAGQYHPRCARLFWQRVYRVLDARPPFGRPPPICITLFQGESDPSSDL
jgi:hypothetical protein